MYDITSLEIKLTLKIKQYVGGLMTEALLNSCWNKNITAKVNCWKLNKKDFNVFNLFYREGSKAKFQNVRQNHLWSFPSDLQQEIWNNHEINC